MNCHPCTLRAVGLLQSVYFVTLLGRREWTDGAVPRFKGTDQIKLSSYLIEDTREIIYYVIILRSTYATRLSDLFFPSTVTSQDHKLWLHRLGAFPFYSNTLTCCEQLGISAYNLCIFTAYFRHRLI